MNKPFSMVFKEFEQNMANLINNSGLSPFIVELVLKNYLNEINNVTKNQYQIDKNEYEKSLLEANDKKEVKS